ncbi:hypothetical protein KPH14_009844 [Odynerus spinipes]|uniref:Cytochrome P450 n=1 Tax=Odynerus spinipes TaxID=1348599 RepID=A0AAD9RX84_9HYME|nr:hypothetical protein KPH14_009844 [Odynerus spinipes]
MAIYGSSILAYGIYIILALAGAFYLWMKNRHSYWKKRGVPSLPSTHWLFGDFKDIIAMRKSASLVLGDFYQQTNKDNKFFGVYVFHKPFLFLKDPQIIKTMLIKDFDIFSNRYFSQKTSKDLATYNLFTVDNPDWKHLRVKMSPLFTIGKIKKLFHLMIETSETMKEYLEQRTKSNSVITVDVKDIFMKYSTDIISSLAFGVRTNSFGEPIPEFYIKSRMDFQPTFRTAMLLFAAFFFPRISEFFGNGLFRHAREYFGRLFWDSYEARKKSGTKRGDLIDYLLELENDAKNSEFKFEGDMLLGQSLIFFIAGRETSTTTMSYALYELAKQPELQDRTRKEIREILKSDGFTYEGVQKMKYLNQVISETLRLYPPAPIIDRVATQDYVIPGTDVVIEKGTPVYAVLTGIHLDPANFPDPLRFDPDRFSDERKHEIATCTYMPFGDGPRVCIGMRVGLLQTAVGIITILDNYEVLLNPTGSYEQERRNVFIVPGKNFVLNFKKTTADN